MKTIIDLKLNLKNFSGVLPNRNRYRIFIETTYNKTLDEYKLEVVIKDSSKYFNTWMHNLKLSTSR